MADGAGDTCGRMLLATASIVGEDSEVDPMTTLAMAVSTLIVLNLAARRLGGERQPTSRRSSRPR